LKQVGDEIRKRRKQNLENTGNETEIAPPAKRDSE